MICLARSQLLLTWNNSHKLRWSSDGQIGSVEIGNHIWKL